MSFLGLFLLVAFSHTFGHVSVNVSLVLEVETSEFVGILLRNFHADKQLTELEASLVFACFKNSVGQM